MGFGSSQPIVHDERFQVLAKEVCLMPNLDSQSEYRHPASRSDMGFIVQRPMRMNLNDNQSIGPASGINQSCFSKFDTEYHEVLLIWEQYWTDACVSKVVSDLNLCDLKSKSIYRS